MGRITDLKQAVADLVDLIAALEQKGIVIRQVSSRELIPFHRASTNENADWYVNLFASRTYGSRSPPSID